MTRPIFEPTPSRKDASLQYGVDQLFRRPAPVASTGQYPIVFRAAIRDITDPEANRVHYVAEDEGNNVYWDEWDTAYDATVFDISFYDQTNDADEGLVIAGVALAKAGLYSIYACVDLGQYINGMVSLGTNWDEGQGIPYYVNNIANGGEPYYGDHYAIQVHQWRYVNLDRTPGGAVEPEGLFGGEAETVEIILNVNTGIDGFGVTGGTWPLGGGGSFIPGAGDVWIPGGYDGAWGLVPRLYVAYWGLPPSGIDSGWPASFGLTN